MPVIIFIVMSLGIVLLYVVGTLMTVPIARISNRTSLSVDLGISTSIGMSIRS